MSCKWSSPVGNGSSLSEQAAVRGMDARKTNQAASIPGAGDGMQEIGMLRSATRSIEVESNEGILSSSSSAMANAGRKGEEEMCESGKNSRRTGERSKGSAAREGGTVPHWGGQGGVIQALGTRPKHVNSQASDYMPCL